MIGCLKIIFIVVFSCGGLDAELSDWNWFPNGISTPFFETNDPFNVNFTYHIDYEDAVVILCAVKNHDGFVEGRVNDHRDPIPANIITALRQGREKKQRKLAVYIDGLGVGVEKYDMSVEVPKDYGPYAFKWRDTRDEDVCYFLIKYESKTLSHGLSLLSQTHTVPRTKRFEFVAYKGYELIDQVFDVKDHISVYVSLHGFSMGVHIAGVIGRFLQEHRHQMVKYLFGWDPAGISLFIGDRMLKHSDAKHIQVVHGAFGTWEAGTSQLFGHVDIFIRGFKVGKKKHHVPTFLHRLTSAKELKIYAQKDEGQPRLGRVLDGRNPAIREPNECVYGVEWEGVPIDGVYYLDYHEFDELDALVERIPGASYEKAWYEHLRFWPSSSPPADEEAAPLLEESKKTNRYMRMVEDELREDPDDDEKRDVDDEDPDHGYRHTDNMV